MFVDIPAEVTLKPFSRIRQQVVRLLHGAREKLASQFELFESAMELVLSIEGPSLGNHFNVHHD